MTMILQKFMVEAGYCSRRRATELIKTGRVAVNGQKAEPGARVGENDDVRIGGVKLRLKKNKIYIKLNKPIGYTCTNRKFKGEKNIFELLPKKARQASLLHVAGRLDKNSRGLILLTNDGNLTKRLTHPKYGHEKTYIVKIKNQNANIKMTIQKLKRGIEIDRSGEILKAKDVKYLENNEFEIVLTEGKKRQIRRMFKALGYEVDDLKRMAIGGLKLGNLKEGGWKYLTAKDLQGLRFKKS